MQKANTATSHSGTLGSSLRWSRVPKTLSTALGSTYSASSALLAFFSMKMAEEATTPAGHECPSQGRTQAAPFPERPCFRCQPLRLSQPRQQKQILRTPAQPATGWAPLITDGETCLPASRAA